MNLLLKQMKNTIQLEMLNWWSIYKPSWSGVADKQMSDDTFNEQEWEAVETTAIDHAVAQFEIPPIVNLAQVDLHSLQKFYKMKHMSKRSLL